MPSDTDKRPTPIKKRSVTILIGLFLFFVITFFLFSGSSDSTIDCSEATTTVFHPSKDNGNIIDMVQQLSSPSEQQRKQLAQVSFQNLNEDDDNNNNNNNNQVAVFIVLPPWAIKPSLKTFFRLLALQTHHSTRISLLILNPPSPTTIYTVRQYLSTSHLIHRPIELYTKTYPALTPWIAQDDHHDATNAIYELAPLRKSAMARAKNYLLQTALDPLDRYVLWLDPLLSDLPTTMIQDFIQQDTDILVPNTMILKDGVEWGYDRSNWKETTMSTSLQETVPADFVFMEGWWEYDTHRFLMVDMISEEEQGLTRVELDGVGSTCLFVKADVHRHGLGFFVNPYQHQLDSEAFAKAAKVEGYRIIGLPNYKVYHADVDDEEEYNDNDNNNNSNSNNSADDIDDEGI